MTSFHQSAFEVLGIEPQTSKETITALTKAERRLGLSLPASVREWYALDGAVSLLAKHSNADPPIAIPEFEREESPLGPLLPIRRENQGVCRWAVRLDGSEDPPVLVDVDPGRTEWRPFAPTFSTYVLTCLWDYQRVFFRPKLVQAQNGPISDQAIQTLASYFAEQPRTEGWPGHTQYRFEGAMQGILLWSLGNQTDWFVGADDEESLELVLRSVWNLDAVGSSFYDCSDVPSTVLEKVQATN